MNTLKRKGKISSFYSFKGGTGRTMALANVAWILASSNRRVLAVDWDLEAPGLHYYFYPYLEDPELTSSRGIIDLVKEYAFEAVTAKGAAPNLTWFRERAAFSSYIVPVDFEFNGNGCLDLLPAGRQGLDYGSRVNSFNWQRFYYRLGGAHFIDALRDRMREQYDYVLVDSRTGVSDTAGICTIQIPDSVVLCFMLNQQSIHGAVAAVRTMADQRRNQGKFSEFGVFPVPMRVNEADSSTENFFALSNRRIAVWKILEPLLGTIAEHERERYKRAVEIPYTPVLEPYEVLATLCEDSPALSAYLSLAKYIADSDTIEFLPPTSQQRSDGLQKFAKAAGVALKLPEVSTDQIAAAVRKAEELFQGLPLDKQHEFVSICTRLTRVSPVSEGGKNAAVKYRLSDLSVSLRAFTQELAKEGFLYIDGDDEPSSSIGFVDESLVRTWPRLKDWVESSREFLEWRQRLDSVIFEWEGPKKNDSTLLPRGNSLREAKRYLEDPKYQHDISLGERAFIERAISRVRYRDLVIKALIVVGAVLVALLIYSFAKQQEASAKRDSRERAMRLNLLGTQHLAAGEWDDAIKDFDHALESDADLLEAYLNRGIAYLKRRNPLAIPDFTAVLERQPDNKDVLDLRAQAFEMAGKSDLAVADWTQAIEKDRTDAEAYHHLGDAYRRRGQYDLSMSYLTKAIERKQRFPEALLNRGKLKYAMGDNHGAIIDLTEAIENRAGRENQLDLPQLADALITRGHCNLALREKETARNDYSAARQVDPKNAWAPFYEAEAYKTDKGYVNPVNVMQYYGDAIKIDDKNPAFYYARGYLNYVLALPPAKFPRKLCMDARSDFTQAILFKPEFAEAFALRSDCNLKIGKRDEAVADYRRALELGVSEPFAAEVMKRLGPLIAKSGQAPAPERKRIRPTNRP